MQNIIRQRAKPTPRKKLLAPIIKEKVVERCRGRKRKVRGDDSDEDNEATSSGNESYEGEVSYDTEEVSVEGNKQNQLEEE